MTRADEHGTAILLGLLGACLIVALGQCGDVHAQPVERMVQACFERKGAGPYYVDAAFTDWRGTTTARYFEAPARTVPPEVRAMLNVYDGAACVYYAPSGRVIRTRDGADSPVRDEANEADLRAEWRKRG